MPAESVSKFSSGKYPLRSTVSGEADFVELCHGVFRAGFDPVNLKL